MTGKKYEDLVIRLETHAVANFRAFRWRVCLYMAWGYLLMVVLFGLILGVAILLLLGRMFGWAARYLRFGVGFGNGMWKGLWLKVPAPDEFKIERSDAKQLFQMIDETCAKLQAPKVDSLYLMLDCNASAGQSPKFGPFGPFHNTVMVGLPLLAMLDREELQGVLAHEIGHIHKGHSRFSLRVGQVSGAWEGAVVESVAKGMKADLLIKIVDTYSPWLAAAKIVLDRMAEREANIAEAAVVGEQASARISAAMHLYPPEAERIWAGVTRETYAAEVPPDNFVTQYFESLSGPIKFTDLQGRLAKALQEPNDPFASHPNLTQLFEAVNVEPTMDSVVRLASAFQSPRENAGESIFGSDLDSFLLKADRYWSKRYSKVWKEARDRFVKTEEEIAKLLEAARDKPPADDERLALAERLFSLDRPEEAQIWMAGHEDDSPRARFLRALILRDLQNQDWIALMETAVAEFEFEVPASNYLIAHYNHVGDRGSVQRLYDRLHSIAKLEETAKLNYNSLAGPWRYSSCDWTSERRSQLTQTLSGYRDISKAYLVTRALEGGRYSKPVLVVQRKAITLTDGQNLLKQLVQHESLTGCLVFAMGKAPAGVTSVAGSLVYDANLKPE